MTGPKHVVTEVFEDTPTLHIELQQWLTAAETAHVCVAVICKTKKITRHTEHDRFLMELEQMV